uniref:RAB26, member RAS oncogene family n=1 Tax=Callorhinchus milii TaxID=7868 RepID=A0A4W3HLJ1_CALMI
KEEIILPKNFPGLYITTLIGDSGVGKTCLLVRFKDGAFLAGSFISTVGIDFRNNSYVLSFQIWDTAGQERFRSVTHAYYRDAHGKATLLLISAWLTEIHEYATQDVVIMMLGNKADATQERAVKKESGEKLAKEYGVPFMETSAKTGLNVELAFIAIAKELKHRSMKSPSDPKFKLHDYVNSEMKGSGCCKS